jgi:hypothetical protein
MAFFVGVQRTCGSGACLAMSLLAIAALPSLAAANCGSNYHRALSEIAAKHITPATEALNTARRSEAGLPGRWMFGPYSRSGKGAPRPVASETVTETSEKTVCLRPAKDEGGACLQEERRRTQKQVTLDPLTPPTPDRPRNIARQEQALYHLADGYVKATAQVTALQMQSPTGIVARRIASDLRGYTGQAAQPALCAGAPELMDYLERQAGPLKRQVLQMRQAAQTGQHLAALRIASLKTMLRNGGEVAVKTSAIEQNAASAGLVTGAIDATSQIQQLALKSLVADAASLALEAEDAARVANQLTALAALREVRVSQARRTGAALSESARDTVEDALGLLEAAAYVGHAGALHAAVGDGLIGGFAAIRAAHAQSCKCADGPAAGSPR